MSSKNGGNSSSNGDGKQPSSSKESHYPWGQSKVTPEWKARWADAVKKENNKESKTPKEEQGASAPKKRKE